MPDEDAQVQEKTVAMFVGDAQQWYVLTDFVDPSAGRPTGWVEAKAGGETVWIDLAMAFKVFVYDGALQP